MHKVLLVFVVSIMMVTTINANSNHWAVLVAGSQGFVNYRHQADVCHAYHLLKKKGIPEDQIIVMAFDDVAFDDENPFPGTLYNKQDGEDVYNGCNIDYTGHEVNKHNFQAVLQGDYKSIVIDQYSNSTKKVLESDENSKVFLYFSDHGAPGHLFFPDTKYYADELNQTIKFMHLNKMYSELIIFLEACESGSIFENIDLKGMNAWALTATNATAPSWGTYCFPHDTV